MDFLNRFFDREDDESLFFILVFLFLFISNCLDNGNERSGSGGKEEILFFIVFTFMLLLNAGLLGNE